MGKEALDDDDETDRNSDRRRRRRGYSKTSAHPLLSPTLSSYFLFSLSISHYYIFRIILTINAERNVIVLLDPSPQKSHLPRLTIP